MDLLIGFYKRLYWPICRVYAKYIIRNKPSDNTLKNLCSIQFYKVNHYWPNFVKPTRFSEKIWYRMLFERKNIYTALSDKLISRKYVSDKIGDEFLIPLLWTGDDPEKIPFEKLPSKFVIKTNHGAGYNILVNNKTQIDLARTKAKLKKWLNENFCNDKYLGIAWGYKNIKSSIMIEEFIEENGKVPTDYKFWCFSGRVECISLHFDRFEKHSTMTLDRDFKPYEFHFPLPLFEGFWKRPLNYETMVEKAEKLAEGMDFVRIDFYNIDNKIYFGEFTFYPGGVSVKFDPPEADYHMGKLWQINNNIK